MSLGCQCLPQPRQALPQMTGMDQSRSCESVYIHTHQYPHTHTLTSTHPHTFTSAHPHTLTSTHTYKSTPSHSRQDRPVNNPDTNKLTPYTALQCNTLIPTQDSTYSKFLSIHRHITHQTLLSATISQHRYNIRICTNEYLVNPP